MTQYIAVKVITYKAQADARPVSRPKLVFVEPREGSPDDHRPVIAERRRRPWLSGHEPLRP
jgi:hypothetical protein